MREFFEQVQQLENEAAQLVEQAVREARAKVENAEKELEQELARQRRQKEDELKTCLLEEEQKLRALSKKELDDYSETVREAAVVLRKTLSDNVSTLVERYLEVD